MGLLPRGQQRVIYKVGLLGASGRMGQEIAALLSEGFTVGSDAFELSDGVTQSGRLLSVEGMPLRRMEDPPREPVHVWIDFSRPEGTLNLLENIDVPVVIGTTGFSDNQLAKIESYSKTVPVLLCPNTSPGMAAMSSFIGQLGSLASLGFSAFAEEQHHRLKKDSPSGTAKRLLETLKNVGFGEVPMQVTRAGSIVGNHRVRFIADGEELLIEHRVTDRRVFAQGALWGAHFLLQRKQARVYRFEEVQR